MTSQSSIPRASRLSDSETTIVQIGDVRVGDGAFAIVAGPCAVESLEQIVETACAVQGRGATMLRGGAFKPRTNPYTFQGLGWDAVAWLAEAGRASGLPTVSEVMTIGQLERMSSQIDVLQVGARNMQNFDLLKAVGRVRNPILLKRGLSATIEELLAAAEYILAEGNPNVILCERGIRTFETATRNTLDLSAVPVLRERSHLPILVDPSHGVGVRRWIAPLCRAAKAVGAHGLLLEVHPTPAESRSDPNQALDFEEFGAIVEDLKRIPIAWPRESPKDGLPASARVRGIRGAITVDADDADSIAAATMRLLIEMKVRNEIDPDDIASMFLSLTPDLRSSFPGVGARTMGWSQVPMLHLAELDIVGGLERCIRILIHANTMRKGNEIRHVYIDDAVSLRPDLACPTP